MILSLVPQTDPILRTPTQPFDFDNPPMDPVALFEDLKQTMLHNKGLGLSANQVGIPYAVFVFGNPLEPDSVAAAFNPKIVDVAGEPYYMEEGCLSFPHLFIKVKRPPVIRVRYTTQHNVTDTIKFEGMTARIFLHETDHLNGLTFIQVANRFHVDQARRKAKKHS